MDTFVNLLNAFSSVLQPVYLLYALAGALLGTFVGVIPGLGPTVTMAMLLPVVFVLGDPAGAIIMFAGIFYGAMYGGATTAILLNTPGESNAVVTALNGYRMAKAGRAGAALLASALGSFMASILATFALAFVAEPLAAIALTLGPPEFVAFVMLALSSAAVLGGRPLKAAFSTLFGLAVGTVGINITTGVSRFDLGQLVLKGGIDFELVSIGMFAVVEVLFVVGTLRLSGRTRRIGVIGKLYMTVEEWRRSILPWLRGSALGFLVGVLPGAGTTMASYISYGTERSLSKTPEKFGRGRGMIEGVAGPEAASNAAAVGSLAPMLALGIPGSAATAVMIVALQGLGVKTGPLLIRDTPDLVWVIIASLFVGNVMLVILNIPLIRLWVKIISVPTALLAPMIIVVCSVGVFSLSRNTVDLLIMLIFAFIGLGLRACDIPLAPAILGLVLGPLLEIQWGRALVQSGGSWSIFLANPLSVVVYCLALAVISVPVIQYLVRRRGRRQAEIESADA